MLSTRTLKPTALALMISMAVSGCASVQQFAQDNNSYVMCGVGAAAGAALGGIIAAANNQDPWKYAGAGAIAGCVAGVAYKARADKLREVAQREGIKMKVDTITIAPATPMAKPAEAGLKASVESSSMFDVGSATLTADGQRQVRAMAEVIADKRASDTAQQTGGQSPAAPKLILVVGHTDSTGSAETNKILSEKRARAVASILGEAGIPRTDIYFQGAGASRPIADNTSPLGRDKNRRVEITEVADKQVLAKLVEEDRNNPRYLAHGTSSTVKVSSVARTNKKAAQQSATTVTAPVVQAPAVQPSAAPAPTGQVPPSIPRAPAASQVSVAALPQDKALKISGSGSIDFGGDLVRSTTSTLAQSLTPKPTSFSFIDTANASAPVTSCLADMPRTTGEIKSLATGTTVSQFRTSEYMVGMNGRTWGKMVNGHYASLGPVAILKDSAKVAQEPEFQATVNAKSKPKETPVYKMVANTYEGDGEVLYRVFAVDANKAPISCLDIVFDTGNGVAKAGEMFYSKGGDAFVASFTPDRR